MRIAAACLVLCLLGAIVWLVPSPADDPPRTEAAATSTTSTTTTTVAQLDRIDRPASVSDPEAAVATRGTAVTIETTTSTTTTVPLPIPGDCDSWEAEFARRGATDDDRAFFFGAGIIWRETRCGADTLNEASGDTGICQINPIHNRAGYFGGRYFGDGGWLGVLHGLRTRVEVDSPAWVDACLTLRAVCGDLPWRPPYGCENRRL
jgi:hypothetical protein